MFHSLLAYPAIMNDHDIKLPWVEKYRPRTLDEIISHDRIIETLKNFIKKKCFPHLLFHGPPGTGKTSTIFACAKELFGKSYPLMVLELNASDDRGIEVVRNRIKQFVSAKSVFFHDEDSQTAANMFKLVILDETDAMTGDAQAILRKVVEKYTKTTRFCLICNFVQNIIPALQSRCTKFRFSPIANNKIKTKIISVKQQENIKLTPKGLNTLLKRSKGDMRKIFNILQSTSMAYDIVNEKNVNNCVGFPQKLQIFTIMNSLIEDDFTRCYKKINRMILNYGLNLCDIITEIHDIMINHILHIKNPNYTKNINKLSKRDIMIILDKLRDIEYYLSFSQNKIQLGAFIGIFMLVRSEGS